MTSYDKRPRRLTWKTLFITLGSAAYSTLRRIFSHFGFHFIRKHYYQPIPDEADLKGDFFSKASGLPGVNMNEEKGLELLDKVFPLYLEEFRAQVPVHQADVADDKQFYLINGSYMAVDAHVYYAFIRYFKPGRIIEIGGGMSSLLAGIACERNFKETGQRSRLTVIEPFPSNALKEGFPGLSDLLEAKVQDVDLNLFASLGSGDILFVDSTHVLRAGGDVQLEYLEIIPRLAPGVLVHIHDISLPKPYPRVYFDNGLYWNEQYLLQAFLAFNSRFEVLWPGNYMMIKFPEKVCEVFPEFHIMRQYFPQSEPSSFWMRVRS